MVGGGNTAMDAVRTASRLGAKTSYLIYRRSEAEMPARAEEAKHAKEEGITFMCLTNPVAFLGDKEGFLEAVRCIRMELGEPDASGRRSPRRFRAPSSSCRSRWRSSPCGTEANPLVAVHHPGPEDQPQGLYRRRSGNTADSKNGVFAGGDIVTGAATVILAMGAGRRPLRP